MGLNYGPLGAGEQVDLVDDKDRVVGHAPLSDCLSKGLLHRAVAVIVLRRNGAVLLQRRSGDDLWNPGLWTLSCTGHVKRGETYRKAAVRELAEELGLSSNLRTGWKLKLPPMTDRGLTEREFVTLFTSTTDAVVTPDPEELSEAREFPPAELAAFIRQGPLTQDARIMLMKFLRKGG